MSVELQRKEAGENIEIGDIRLDAESRCLFKEGERIRLTKKEYLLLWTLMSAPGEVFTHKALFETVWGEDYLSDNNTLTVHISHLRDYIEEDGKNPRFIRTVRGKGYTFVK